jgi:O-antigen ligase
MNIYPGIRNCFLEERSNMIPERLSLNDPVLLIILFSGIAFIVYYGRVEMAAGIYLATQRWAYSVTVGPTVWLWVWAFALIASGVVFYLRQAFRTRALGRKIYPIDIWTAIWLVWMFLLWWFNPSVYATQLIKNILVYNVLSFIAIWLFGSDLSRVKVFALVFVGATLVSGIVALSIQPGESIAYQIQLSTFRLRGLDLLNYTAFSVSFALAIIFLLTIASRTSKLRSLLPTLAAIAFCVFCLILTGARQSILGLFVAALLLGGWVLWRRKASVLTSMIALASLLVISILIYNQSALWSRWTGPEAGWETFGGRIPIWQEAWQVFLRSPIWGSGVDYFSADYGAHNLWLDALAGQGLVGFVLLNGFLVIVLRSARGTWVGIGGKELASWRMGAFCILVYVLVQSVPAGQIAGMPHLFWGSALVCQLGVAARRVQSHDKTLPVPHASAVQPMEGAHPTYPYR